MPASGYPRRNGRFRLLVIVGIVGLLLNFPQREAQAWCYVVPLSASLDWEWNGRDANMDWGGGDIGFDPLNAHARAVREGPKAPVLDANNFAIAGWTARSRGNNSAGYAIYGAIYATSDSYAWTLAQHLRPCT